MGWWDEVKGAHKKALKSGHWAKSYDALWGDIEDPTIKDYLSGGKADVGDAWGLQEERDAKEAERRASDTQYDMYMKGLEEQQRQYDLSREDSAEQLEYGRRIAEEQYNQGREDMAPWMQAGGSALDTQSNLIGLGGTEAQQQAYDDYQLSPGQQFLRDRGEKAMVRNASAIGGLGGGNVRSDLQQQGIGFAAQDFGNYYSRLAGMSGTGQTSTAQQGQAGANYAGNMGRMGQNYANSMSALGQNFGNSAANQYGLAGNARASGIFGIQQANANQNNQMWNTVGSIFGMGSGSGSILDFGG